MHAPALGSSVGDHLPASPCLGGLCWAPLSSWASYSSRLLAAEAVILAGWFRHGVSPSCVPEPSALAATVCGEQGARVQIVPCVAAGFLVLCRQRAVPGQWGPLPHLSVGVTQILDRSLL